MNKIHVILGLFFCCASLLYGADRLSSMQQRRSDIDVLLLKQKVIEGADGFLRANKNTKKGLSQKDVGLITQENNDRRSAFIQIAADDATVKDVNDAGQKFALKYIGFYKKGVLRENPANQIIYDNWPPEIKSAEELINKFFGVLDSEESKLMESVEK